MYCSSCGADVMQGVSFCNHCGTRLALTQSGHIAKQLATLPESLIWAIVAIFVIGLGCTIGLMAMMKELLNFNNTLIVAFALFCLSLMTVVEGVFIWMLLTRHRSSKESGDKARLKEQVTKELNTAQARALPEAKPSVTEHTTRTLEPAFSERKST